MTGSWLRACAASAKLAAAMLAVASLTRAAPNVTAVSAEAGVSTGPREVAQGAIEGEPPLVVDRASGAESCPDAGELTRSVESVRGRSAPASIRYKVHFSRQGTAFGARIEDRTSRSVRELSDVGNDCSGIARATAITLALLFDAEPETNATSTNDAANAAPASKRPTRPALVPEPQVDPPADVSLKSERGSRKARDDASWSSAVHLGAAALAGVAAPSAFGPSLAVDVAARHWRGEVEAIWSPSQTRSFQGGTIATSLLVGSGHVCLTPARLWDLRLEVCSGVTLGRITAEAAGFVRNVRSHRPWIAIPVLATVASDVHTWGWQAGIGALIPGQREDFQIAGLELDYRAWPVAGALFLRLSARAH